MSESIGDDFLNETLETEDEHDASEDACAVANMPTRRTLDGDAGVFLFTVTF